MNLLIQHLTEDHKHFVGVLYHLEREIKAYGGLLKTAPNADAIVDILDYIQVYPQVWHHPIEDVIYEMLLEKDIPDPEKLADLMQEHGILDMLTDYLHHIFNTLSQGQDVAVAQLIKRTSEFIQRQLKHIKLEQSIFFPLAERYLGESDWDKIQIRLQGKMNLTGEVKWQQYKLLYKNIVGGSALIAH